MVFGTLVRYGIPLSFVYCTIYKQNIWREGDENLILEQKRIWRDFFQLVDDGCLQLTKTFNFPQDSNLRKLNLLEKIDSTDVKQCWNAQVSNAFAKISSSSLSNVLNVGELAKSLGITKS